MKDFHRLSKFHIVWVVVLWLFIVGCQPVEEKPRLAMPEIGPETTIGSLVEVFSFDAVLVEGYSIVGGLSGTGSSDCPAQIRRYMGQYILKKLPQIKVQGFIEDKSTAVVVVRGMMPTAGAKTRYFDVSVSAYPGTQTTSLRRGRLYGADFREAGVPPGGAARILATAEGPIYIDTIDPGVFSEREGRILGGGRTLDEYTIRLTLRAPDYKTISRIRDRINERFGPKTAQALSRETIQLSTPVRYGDQKTRFIALLRAMYLIESNQLTNARVGEFVRRLAVDENKRGSEIALEAIGSASAERLAVLLNISDEEVRLRAGRCLLNLGNDAGAEPLRRMAMSDGSPYRVEALDAIVRLGKHNDATALARRLLRDGDFNIRLAAYESLRKLGDVSIREEVIGGDFVLEQVQQANRNAIYVYRSGRPRVVLFGLEMNCREDVFVQSDEGNITINAPAGQGYVSIMRRHPTRPNVPPITVRSSFEVAEIVRRMCESAVVDKDSGLRPGLEVPYAEAVGVLKKMCELGAIDAEFRAGPLTRVELLIK